MLSIVMPAYNEEKNIARIPKELLPHLEHIKKKYGQDYEILIIDDGSKDGTLKVAKNLEKKNSRIKVLIHEKNQGLGQAIRTGINAAKGDMIVTYESDFTWDPSQIDDLLKEYSKGGFDCVMGSPYLGGYSADVPKYRAFLSYACNVGYSVLLGTRITSASPLFRIYNAKKVKQLQLEAKGFDINAEILVKILQTGGVVDEIPARLTTRIHGVSSLDNKKVIMNHLKIYKKIIQWKLKRKTRK